MVQLKEIIDFSKPVYDISKDNPEVIEIMKTLGFENITNPAMLNTAGRFMTIAKGAEMKNLDLDIIKEAFIKKGYNVKL